MQIYMAVAAAVLALSLWINPGDSDAHISSTSAEIKIAKAVEIVRVEKPVFSPVIAHLSVTPEQSTPPSVIVSGQVVSNNSGTAQEFAPIFLGSTLHLPRLAALTNVDGEFRFRVWLLDKPYDKRIEEHNQKLLSGSRQWQWKMGSRLLSLISGEVTLYLDGLYNKDAEMVSSYTHIYPLGRLSERSAQQKPQNSGPSTKSFSRSAH